MIIDVIRISDDWIDLYAAAAIPVGTGCIVQNKLADSLVLLWEGATAPVNHEGVGIVGGEISRVTAGGAGLWCRAGPAWPGCTQRFRVSIQVAT
jgi:hypothetical protein